MDEQIVLRAKGICKSFASGGNRLKVLADLDLEIMENKLTVIVGSSGVGKSTLLHILGGLDTPDAGEVILDATRLFSLNDRELSSLRNQSLGFVFQFHHLLAEFDALENVMIPRLIAGQNKSDAREKAYHILEDVGLRQRHSHRPAELSGGEQQRLAVARALVNEPRLVIADEPTGNLDRTSSGELIELIIKLTSEKHLTFVMATHNLEIARQADYVHELSEGKIHPKK
jgi:lipoprotein-releasing system ATP-binding protein